MRDRNRPRSDARALGEPVEEGSVRITSLGGLGQVGLNCLLIDQGDERLIIDCGISFPPSAHGVERLEPPLGLLAGGCMRVVGVVVTHGHEDHIGAVPTLLRRYPVPTWGPRHALELLRERLEESEENEEREEPDAQSPGWPPKLIALEAGTTAQIGSFRLEAIRVAHSIAEAVALCIETTAGRIVHSGDFTLRGSGAHATPTDVDRLAELGDGGVRLLLADSTNVESSDPGPDEPRVRAALDRLIGQAPARVVVGCFASNVHRMRSLQKLAVTQGRQLCLLGRSMVRHAELGRRLGLLDEGTDVALSAAVSRERPRKRLLVAATGTQAEHRGALRRLSLRDHPALLLEPDDTVILSCRTIPGNERAVGQMVDGLWRQGVTVVSRAVDPEVHTSGHACSGDLETLLELVRPELVVPVHGGRNQLERLARLARRCGPHQALVRENGEPFLVGRAGPPVLLEPFEATPVPIGAGGPLTDTTLAERRALGRGGVLLVTVALDESGHGELDVHALGLGLTADQRTTLRTECRRAVAAATAQVDSDRAVERAVQRAANVHLRTHAGLRPVVAVTVTRAGGTSRYRS